VFTDKLKSQVAGVVTPPFEALFLYGSHARGDATENSDVDILQVTAQRTPPYSVGRYNITCYTTTQLLRLARAGSLFARHLIGEAAPLMDPNGILESMRSAYIAPPDYEALKQQVRYCAPLLDVDSKFFLQNTQSLISLVCYLLRTFLYALAFQRGAASFSMQHLVELLGQREATTVIAQSRRGGYPEFLIACRLLEELSDTKCVRREGSLEAFIVNSHGTAELAVVLGLRILAHGRAITYDPLADIGE
jgi:hypothetical protein